MKPKPKPKDWRSRPRPYARKPEADAHGREIQIRLTPGQREALERTAAAEGVSLAEVCRRALAAFCDGEPTAD
jgi:hypothetical protein